MPSSLFDEKRSTIGILLNRVMKKTGSELILRSQPLIEIIKSQDAEKIQERIFLRNTKFRPRYFSLTTGFSANSSPVP